MQNAIKANEADSMFRLYSCSFGIACQSGTMTPPVAKKTPTCGCRIHRWLISLQEKSL